MTIQKKTAQDFAADIESAIISRNSSYDTKIGPIPDLVINPISGVLELQNERARAVQQLLSLSNDAVFTRSDVDAFVYNELIVRSVGSKSRVVLTFSRTTPPTVDQTVKANFPVATLADEETGSAITFVTINDATMVAANAGAYFNSTTQKYELQVSARAVTNASSGDVAPGRIVRPLRPLNGFESVTNKTAATGGKNAETNAELIERYILSIIGSSPSVVRGIEKILRDLFPETIDSNVVFGNNALNVRSSTDGGAVDVYVIGSSPTSVTESYTFTGPDQVIALNKQPVIEIQSILPYTQGTDYVLQKDTTGNAGSVRARDGVRFNSAYAYPTIGSVMSVTYVYDALQATLQDAFTAADYNVTGRDILFKEAEQVDVTITASLKIRPGFSVAQVTSFVTSAILAFINAKTLGESVEVSDIQATVRAYSAVDNFIISNIAKVGSTGTVDIPINPRQFARMAIADLTITVI